MKAKFYDFNFPLKEIHKLSFTVDFRNLHANNRPRLSWDTSNDILETGFDNFEGDILVNQRKSKDNDVWSLETSSRRSTKENAAALAKYLKRKSLASVSNENSRRSSLKSEPDNVLNSWYKANVKGDLFLEGVSLTLNVRANENFAEWGLSLTIL